jgi:hypothetical protein
MHVTSLNGQGEGGRVCLPFYNRVHVHCRPLRGFSLLAFLVLTYELKSTNYKLRIAICDLRIRVSEVGP